MLYQVSYQVVETPLNEFEWQEPIRIEEHEIPGDPIQQRMMVILAFALVVIVGLAVFIVSKWGEPVIEAAAADSAVSTNTTVVENAPAAIPAVSGALSPVFSAQIKHWEPQILAWAAQYSLDPDIVATIMQIESCGDPNAVSRSGAQGLFQVMPFHFATGEDMQNPDTNAMRGLNFYTEQLRHTSGDIFLSFAGYNGGYAASNSSWDNWAHETQRYYTWAKGIYEDAKAGLATSPTLEQWMAAGGVSLCQQASNRLGLTTP